MSNPFSGLLNTQFKNTFNQAIDAIIEQGSLSVPCILKYNSTDTTYCTNCTFDPILNKSFNEYNGTGPISFPNGSLCPVCGGFGKIIYDAEETIYMASIFDSKYWLNWGPKFIQIPNLAVQTLCKISLLPKLQNATSVIIDTSISGYGNHLYTKAGEPTPMGLGDHRYILTNWTRP